MRAINTVPVAFSTRGQPAYAPPPSYLPSSSKKSGLAKHLLSCHPQEGCLAAKKIRERGERREKSKTLTKLRDFIYKNKTCLKLFPSFNCCLNCSFLFTKWEGAYIGHPMYENTIRPNILAKLKDKRVIHQK